MLCPNWKGEVALLFPVLVEAAPNDEPKEGVCVAPKVPEAGVVELLPNVGVALVGAPKVGAAGVALGPPNAGVAGAAVPDAAPKLGALLGVPNVKLPPCVPNGLVVVPGWVVLPPVANEDPKDGVVEVDPKALLVGNGAVPLLVLLPKLGVAVPKVVVLVVGPPNP